MMIKIRSIYAPIHSPHKCDHCEDRGDPKTNSRRGGTPVKVKTHLVTSFFANRLQILQQILVLY